MDNTVGSVVDSVINKAGDWAKLRSHMKQSSPDSITNMTKMIIEYCEATNPGTGSVIRHMTTGKESVYEMEELFRRVSANDILSLEVFDLLKKYNID